MLHADLDDLLRGLCGLLALHSLRNVPGHGLFAIEVLAGLERGDEVLGVEVHGCGIDDGIDVFAFEQAHGIVVGVDAGNFGFGHVAAARVSVGHGHALDVGLSQGVIQILHAAIAGADEADTDAVVGAECAHGGHGGNCERAFTYISNKIAAIHGFTSEKRIGIILKFVNSSCVANLGSCFPPMAQNETAPWTGHPDIFETHC